MTKHKYKRVFTVSFHLYGTLKEANLIYRYTKLIVPWMEREPPTVIDGCILYLDCGDSYLSLYMCVKIHWCVFLKWMHLIVLQFIVIFISIKGSYKNEKENSRSICVFSELHQQRFLQIISRVFLKYVKDRLYHIWKFPF